MVKLRNLFSHQIFIDLMLYSGCKQIFIFAVFFMTMSYENRYFEFKLNLLKALKSSFISDGMVTFIIPLTICESVKALAVKP